MNVVSDTQTPWIAFRKIIGNRRKRIVSAANYRNVPACGVGILATWIHPSRPIEISSSLPVVLSHDLHPGSGHAVQTNISNHLPSFEQEICLRVVCAHSFSPSAYENRRMLAST